MGAAPSQLADDDVRMLMASSGFTGNQVKMLYKRFQRLDKDSDGKITTEDFLAVPELYTNPLVDRIIAIFDKQGTSEINFTDFVSTLSIFRPPQLYTKPNQLKEDADNELARLRDAKLKFAFQIYDVDGDGFITYKDLYSVLKMMVKNYVSHDDLVLIVEQTIREADTDGDGMLSFDEFKVVLAHTDIDHRMAVRF